MSWEDNVRKVVPYIPGEQPDAKSMIKLNTNECPYPPAPGVGERMKQLKREQMCLYPKFPEKTELSRELARFYQISTEELFIGVGSDDVLSMAFLTFFHGSKPILFPDITYSFYDVWAEVYGIAYERMPLDEEFRIRPEDYARPNGGVIFPNPNAPTGLLMDLEKVEQIVQANRESVVIVDEAYIDFGGISALPLIRKYDNLLVVQTFSKSRSMAGMRIGYAMGDPKLIRYLNEVKYSVNSYTLNYAALELGAESVKDRAYFRECCERIIRTREQAEERLTALGFIFPKPSGNFIFVSHKEIAADRIEAELKKRQIYVRYWDKDRIRNYLRITIGTQEQMEGLYRALEEIIAAERAK